MQQIIEEYGTAISAMICVLMIIGIVGGIILGAGSPMGQSVTEFANSICGG